MKKQVLQWFLAVLLAAALMNGLCFVYYRPCGRLFRDMGTTESVWNPGSYIVSGTEGYAFYTADDRGYLNENLPLADSYVIVRGASFTQGKEVPYGYRYSDICNKALSKEEGRIKVYNVAQEGEYLPKLIKGFKALTAEFPGADTIVLEINATEFSAEEINSAINQREFDNSCTGKNLYVNSSSKEKIKIHIKEALPLISLLKYQYNLYKEKNASEDIAYAKSAIDKDVKTDSANKSGSSEKKVLDASGNTNSPYEQAINTALSLLRSEYNGNIIFLYHPNVSITEDGLMVPIKESTTSIFKEYCIRNNIIFLDTTTEFINAYNQNFSIPYGYNNTTPCTGHLSKEGHKIIAKVLLEELQKLGK